MKKLNILYLAAFATAAAGCSNDPAEEPAPVNGNTRTIEISALPADDIRSSWTDGEGFHWDETDSFGVFTDAAENVQATDLKIDPQTGAATFKATVKEEASKIWVYYPYRSLDNMATGGDCTAHFNIAAAQTQAAAGRMESSLDKVAFMGEAAQEVTDGPIVAKMQSMASLARFIVYSTDEAFRSESVRSITLQTSEKINGDRFCIGVFANDALRGESAANGTTEIRVTLGTPYALTAADSKESAEGIYMGLFPVSLTGYTYKVVTDKAVYTFTSEKTKTFEQNTMHNIFLNLKEEYRESTEDRNTLTFTHGGKTMNVNSNDNLLYLGPTTGVYNDETVNFNEHPDELPTFVWEGDWVEPKWENTNNFNLQINIRKNKKAEVRETKIYIRWRGVQSSDFITVRQDPGSGAPTVIPTLRHTGYETYTVKKEGETLADAAVLSLEVDGAEIDAAEIDNYMQYVTLSCGQATVTRSGADLSITFPENGSSAPRNYKLTAKTEDGQSELVFTQEAGEGGGDEPGQYTYTIRKNNGNGTGALFGMSPNFVQDADFTITDIQLNGQKVMLDETTAQEVLDQAFKSLEVAEGEVPAGYASYKYDPNAIVAEVENIYADNNMNVHLKTWGEHQYITKFTWYDCTGDELGHWFVFIP